MLYRIIFKDNTIFNGGDTIEDSKWGEIPDKEIICLEYFLCDGSSIVLRNFESYVAITEDEDNVLRKLGNCPKCGKLGKISKALIKYGDGRISEKYVARCKSDKCDWVGNITDLKNVKNVKGDRHKYIMGLKDGIVTSHRIALDGVDGKNKYHSGDITTRHFSKGTEYRGQEPVADFAWKKGIKIK